jgi:hypothetical protein
MLMTFAALVLGLLTSSVKSSFDKVGNDLRGLSVRFYVVLVFWLAIVFGSFGLTAPRNALSYAAIGLVGISIACRRCLLSSNSTRPSQASSRYRASPCATF